MSQAQDSAMVARRAVLYPPAARRTLWGRPASLTGQHKRARRAWRA